jgi:hypothetical protein
MTIKANRGANTGRARGGEQAQWIRDVRSGPWQVTMLEVKKGIQDVPFCLVGQIMKL